ncbi:hypothetical protein [Enterovibrio norvegicus]|uniref:hypothetical protein n=1 Tax=Enterovibrio norvegicus TaxID=188144 RepID=UPI000C84693C|nr:hypothetical protein [Enterovibrio norvegicus]PMH64505.1 hypothetical protein BCU62_15740 [Enterovibrio norvegicus]
MIDKFALCMQKELRDNHEKGDMAVGWKPDVYTLIAENSWHVGKLHNALLTCLEADSKATRAKVTEYAADIANIMAKTAHTFGNLEHGKTVVDQAEKKAV